MFEGVVEIIGHGHAHINTSAIATLVASRIPSHAQSCLYDICRQQRPVDI
jgi:hypothetical protein